MPLIAQNLIYPVQVEALEGQEVFFQCDMAVVEWRFNNFQPLPDNVRTEEGNIYIPNVHLGNEGHYICSGYLQHSRSSSVYHALGTLRVRGLPALSLVSWASHASCVYYNSCKQQQCDYCCW